MRWGIAGALSSRHLRCIVPRPLNTVHSFWSLIVVTIFGFEMFVGDVVFVFDDVLSSLVTFLIDFLPSCTSYKFCIMIVAVCVIFRIVSMSADRDQ